MVQVASADGKKLLSYNEKNILDTHRLPVVSNFVFGHWFHVPPLQFKGAAYILAFSYAIFTNAIFVMFCGAGIYNLISVATSGFKVTVFIITELSNLIHSNSRAVFVLIRKHEVEEISTQLIKMRQRSNVISNVARTISIIFTFLILMYSLIIGLGLTSFFTQYNFENVTLANENEIYLKNAYSNVNSTLKDTPNYIIILIVILTYILSFIGLGKIISTDVLFYSWYMQIEDQYKQLTMSLGVALLHCNRGNNDSTAHWIQTHREINWLLARVNSVTSPCITVSIVVNTTQICIVAYFVAKDTLALVHLAALLIFASLGLFQMFMYCNLGQKIRDQTVKLQEAVYSMPCLGSRRDTQYASLLICNAATERAMPLPGAPFFALSLEFFASILGVVFTYFIVLLQFN
ncbi:Odorant receptor 22 [Ephemera danica]|nr:Odorant receptor 22 [Ephemera danica]